MPAVRRVAALALDVAGYSRLRGADEEGTYERLKAHFREFRPKDRRTSGQIVKTTGDGMLVEFTGGITSVLAEWWRHR